jgi:hypothetical protein
MRLLPVTMQLRDGRARAFRNLGEALDWMDEQEKPRCNERLTISLPTDLKELLRDGPGPMSAEARALICKALGVRWVSASKRGRGKLTKFAAKQPPRKTKAARKRRTA